MFMFNAATIAVALATFSGVAAHGTVSGIIAGGKYYPGYNIGFAYQSDPPTVVGWSAPGDKDTGFIAPSNYTNPDIICHKDATPAGEYATVAAGSTVELQWTPWPVSHHGPVLDYLANCNGECTSVEKTALKFNKIDGVGLLDDTAIPGNWASDKLIAANNSWTVTIPKSIAAGNYVLRHEIIALHSAENEDGAQNYPQCINLKITGAGADNLASGTLGEALYKGNDPGIKVNIYQSLMYTVPGPKLYDGASIAPETSASAIAPSNSAVGSSSPLAAPTISVASVPSVSKGATPPFPTVTASYSNFTLPTGTGKHSKKPCSKTGTVKSHHHKIPVATSTAFKSPATGTPYVPQGSPKPDPSSTSIAEGSESDPTVSATASTLSTSGGAPIPCEASLDGMTVKQLLQLLESVTGQLEKKMGGKMRRHAFGL